MYYKVPIVNGVFVGVEYADIIEGVALTKHVESGYGFIQTDKMHPDLEEITEEEFNREKVT